MHSKNVECDNRRLPFAATAVVSHLPPLLSSTFCRHCTMLKIGLLKWGVWKLWLLKLRFGMKLWIEVLNKRGRASRSHLRTVVHSIPSSTVVDGVHQCKPTRSNKKCCQQQAIDRTTETAEGLQEHGPGNAAPTEHSLPSYKRYDHAADVGHNCRGVQTADPAGFLLCYAQLRLNTEVLGQKIFSLTRTKGCARARIFLVEPSIAEIDRWWYHILRWDVNTSSPRGNTRHRVTTRLHKLLHRLL